VAPVELPKDVADILDLLLGGVRQALAGNLLGVYLCGSLVTGDFIPSTSDVDVLGATDRPVSDREFAALVALHANLAALPNPYARRLEIAYVDRAALKRFVPGLRHPTLGQGEVLALTEHRENWVLERSVVRECGVALLGPDPKTLIAPVAPDELSTAVRRRLQDWADWVAQPSDPEWRAPLSHKAYVVETMCRSLYTVRLGQLVSKPQAVAWALEIFPEPWRALVARSQTWRTDTTVDLSVVPDVMRLVLWIVAQANAADSQASGADSC